MTRPAALWSGSFVRAVSGCRFVLDQTDSDGYRGVIQLQVQGADAYALYKGQGKAVDGIGDEGVSVTGSTVTRVGDLMITIGESSFDEPFENEILRRAAARLK